MKRLGLLFLAMLCFVAFCACGRSQGGSVPATSAPSEGSGGSTTSTATPNNTPTAAPSTAKPTATPEPTPEIDIDWKEITGQFEDKDGYQYRVTMTFSPWILLSNDSVVQAAWEEVSNGKSLPGYDSWGAEDYLGRTMVKGISLYGDTIGIQSSDTMNDMYYCVGTFQVKNITKGWSISSDAPRSIVVSIGGERGEGNKTSKNYGLVAGKVIYSNETKQYVDGIRFSPKMTQDTWGPVTFIFMTSELFTPKTPDGAYSDYVMYDLVFDFQSRWSTVTPLSEEFSEFYVGVIGKDEVYRDRASS